MEQPESALYPLKFLPLYKDKIWGGNKIKTLGFDYDPLPNCGELWALSSIKDNESVISNGFLAENTLNEAIEIYMGDLIGEQNYLRYGNQFPLLIKIIDANEKLSVQVHPDDHLAQERGMENGKTEMWYILETEKNAELIDGFKTEVTPEEYQQFLNIDKVEALLNIEKPQAGDVFFIPAGRVHAIGKGIMLAEIQQTSDCTYRIYDYNRLDKNGKPRELHTAEALAAINFKPTTHGKTNYTYLENKTMEVAACPYFTTNLISLTKGIHKDFAKLDSFVVYLCVEGIAAIKTMNHIVPFHAGECVLVPATATSVELYSEGPAKLLEIYIDQELSKDLPKHHSNDNDWLAYYNPNGEEPDIEEDDDDTPEDWVSAFTELNRPDEDDEDDEEYYDDHCNCDDDHCDCDDPNCDCHHNH